MTIQFFLFYNVTNSKFILINTTDEFIASFEQLITWPFKFRFILIIKTICDKYWFVLLFPISVTFEEIEIRRNYLWLVVWLVSTQFHKFRWYVVFILMKGETINLLFDNFKQVLLLIYSSRDANIHNNCFNRRDKVSKKGDIVFVKHH